MQNKYNVLLFFFPNVLDKVDDPLMAVQISRMLEMPQLYRKCYDKPFQVPGDELCANE